MLTILARIKATEISWGVGKSRPSNKSWLIQSKRWIGGQRAWEEGIAQSFNWNFPCCHQEYQVSRWHQGMMMAQTIRKFYDFTLKYIFQEIFVFNFLLQVYFLTSFSFSWAEIYESMTGKGFGMDTGPTWVILEKPDSGWSRTLIEIWSPPRAVRGNRMAKRGGWWNEV